MSRRRSSEEDDKILPNINSLASNLFDFRSNMSCLSAIAALMEYIRIANKTTGQANYIDFSKSFDRTDLDMSLVKLERYGLKILIVRSIREFLLAGCKQGAACKEKQQKIKYFVAYHRALFCFFFPFVC